MANSSMQNLYAGLYEEILERFQSEKARSAEDFTAWIGAHAFLGRIEEARELLKTHEGKLPLPLRIQSRFFLGVALTRVSFLKEARHLFKKNLIDAKRSSSGIVFAVQG